MRRLAFVLCLWLGLILVVACDGDAEEDLPDGGDEALTAEETFDEVLQATAALESVEIEWTREAEGAEPYTTRQVVTRDGMYWHQDGGLGDFEGMCAEAGAVIEPANICDLDFGEMLWLGEADVYYRSRTMGDWVAADKTGTTVAELDEDATPDTPAGDREASSGTTDIAVEQITVDLGTTTEFLQGFLVEEGGRALIQALPFLTGAPTSIELGPHVSSGDSRLQTLVLSLKQDLVDPADQLANVPAGADEGLDEITAQIAEQIAVAAVRMETDVKLVVDRDFRPQGADVVTRMYATDGRIVHTETATYAYSLWNEAELPGPLPGR